MDKLAEKVARRFLAENDRTNAAPSEEEGHIAVAPEGWEEPIKEMKKNPEIDNPWALANWMKDKGYEPHKEASYLRFANELMRREADWEMTLRDPDGDEPLRVQVDPGSQEHTAVAPPGWEGPVKEMKKDPSIDNPWALAWYMKDKGDKVHKKE